MGEDNSKDYEDGSAKMQDADGDTAAPQSSSRARNKTVMLTPEVTDQLRALLHKDSPDGTALVGDPLSDLLPPVSSWEKPREAISGLIGTSTPPSMSSSRESAPRSSSFGAIPANDVHSASTVAPSKPAFSVNPSARPQAAANTGVGRVQPKVADSKIVGFFISFDKDPHGEVYEIRAGRWLLTSRATEHGDYILVNDETISPLHAIIRATKDGAIQVLDQLSEFGTGLIKAGEDEEEDVSGSMVSVSHGAVIRFGKRHFVVCLVPEVLIDLDGDDKED